MSPEAATTRPWRKIFEEEYFKANLSLLAVDEAHCITEWSVSEVRFPTIFLLYTGEKISVSLSLS